MKFAKFGICIFVLAIMTTSANAQFSLLARNFLGDGNWDDANNWQEVGYNIPTYTDPCCIKMDPNAPDFDSNYYGVHSVPTSTIYTFMRRGTATINSGVIGYGSRVIVGGWDYSYPFHNSVNYPADYVVRYSPGAMLLIKSGGSIYDPCDYKVGNWYDGTVTQEANSRVDTQSLYVGDHYIRYNSNNPSDPNSILHRVVGTYNLNGGTITTSKYFRFGDVGGKGIFNMDGGSVVLTGTTYSFDLGSRQYYDSGLGIMSPSEGSANIKAGTILVEGNAEGGGYVNVGYGYEGIDPKQGNLSQGGGGNGSRGTLNMDGGTIAAVMDIRVGSNGFRYSAGSFEPGLRSFGLVNHKGGSIHVGRALIVGSKHADGIYNLDGGTLIVDGNDDSVIGGATINAGTDDSYANTGMGSFNVTKGVYINSGGGTTSTILGRGVVGTDLESNTICAIAQGTFNMTGGSVNINDMTIGAGDNSRSSGIASITGGSFIARTALIVASGGTTTGTLKVGKSAYFSVGGSFEIRDSNSRLANTYVEVSTGGNTKIYANNASSLGGTLNVYGSRLNKEGDKVNIIMVANYDPNDPNHPYLTGSFQTVLSDLTQGTFAGVPAYAGAIDSNKYTLTFQGMTGGDASGDHRVNIVDLGVLSSKWNNVSGTMTWQNADFSGDGKVNIVDLGVLSSNWSWVKPGSAPAPGGDIPEPATLALISLGALSMIRRRKT